MTLWFQKKIKQTFDLSMPNYWLINMFSICQYPIEGGKFFIIF